MSSDHFTGIGHEVDWAVVRRWKRYHVEMRVKVAFTQDGKTAVVYGMASDISPGGMAIYASAQIAVGEEISLEMTLPYAREPIRAQAKIRNRRDYRYGLEFLPMEEDVRQTIEKVCKALELTQR